MKNYLINSYPNRGVTFVQGEGMYLIDTNGEKYLDLGTNYGVSVFGYHHPRITVALIEQVEKLVSLHGSFGSEVRNLAAAELVGMVGGNIASLFFSNSGAEAVEGALKFATLATGKKHFIALSHSYHGKTLGALSATSGDKYREAFKPLLWDFSHVSLSDHAALAASVRTDTAALILEPVQGEGGIHVFTREDMTYVQELCRQKQILLIVDEIQTGVGRTGTFLASEQYGLMPDIVCMGKGIGGGIPIGVTLVTEAVAEKIPMHVHTSTFGGNPLAAAGVRAVISEFKDEKLLGHIQEMGIYFLTGLRTLKHPSIQEARGIGLMLALELHENATMVLKALQEEKIIAIPAGSNIVRFLPPYLITTKEIDRVVAVLQKIFA